MIPVFAVLPLYLTRLVSAGSNHAGRAAFGYVLDAFGWFIDSYRQLARWSATVERLVGPEQPAEFTDIAGNTLRRHSP